MTEHLIPDEQFLQWLDDSHDRAVVRGSDYKAMLARMPVHFPTLFRLLKSANVHQQRLIVRFVHDIALHQKISHPDSVHLFITHFSETTDAELKKSIYLSIRNLMSFGRNHNLPHSTLELFLHEDARIRQMMATLAIRVPSPNAVPYLIALLHDDDSNVHRLSKTALQNSGSAEASLALAEWEKRQ